MAKGFHVMALDKDYQIIALLRCTNIQWTRKYYEPGAFSIEIPLEQYDARYSYIYTKDRPEMGFISQINYIDKSKYKAVNLSGLFLENELNRRVVYRKGTTNISNSPSWTSFKGSAENVAYAYFDAFKDVIFSDGNMQHESRSGIGRGTAYSRGLQAEHERCGEYLGDKIYSILKPSELSYRISYDFESNEKIFSVWSGRDRTQEQKENNPVTFSTRYGNIKEPNILIDNTGYKNGCIVDNENSGAVYARAVLNREPDEMYDSFTYVKSSVNRTDYPEDADFYSALGAEANAELMERVKLINTEFDTLEGSYEYMADFDLGDKCSIEIPEIEISANAILIGCHEVIKSGVWNLTLEFGTPILRR